MIEEYPQPEWTKENRNRKTGDTTFLQCGWCKYHGSGSLRYDCLVKTYCTLLRHYGPLNQELYWDTPCIIVKLGKKDFETIRKSKKDEIEIKKAEIQRLNSRIEIIQKLELKDRPPLPEHRPYNYFDIGETICAFTENAWNYAKVIDGYRHHEGLVNYKFSSPGVQQFCGFETPCVLKNWEFGYFETNHEDFKTWLNLCDREYNGKRLPLDEYFKAMKKIGLTGE